MPGMSASTSDTLLTRGMNWGWRKAESAGNRLFSPMRITSWLPSCSTSRSLDSIWFLSCCSSFCLVRVAHSCSLVLCGQASVALGFSEAPMVSLNGSAAEVGASVSSTFSLSEVPGVVLDSGSRMPVPPCITGEPAGREMRPILPRDSMKPWISTRVSDCLAMAKE
ncbi:hypothetical protein D3C72_1615590 [compost metagenome]